MFAALLRCASLWAASLLAVWAWDAPAQLYAAQPAYGADLSAMIAHVRVQHPDVATAALETDMAAARASAADSLPDPNFITEFNNNTWRGSAWSDQSSNRKYMVEQTFPLGGKRELRRSVATADRDEADSRRRSIAEDLVLRVKTVQAQRYATISSLRLLHDQHALLSRVIDAADRAYAQGRTGQDASLMARLNLSRHEVEIVRLEGEQRRLDARLAGLLGQSTVVELAPPLAFAPIPPLDGLNADSLLVLARERSPDLAQQETRIARGEQQRKLADSEWIPDVSLGARIVEESFQARAYEGVVSFNIPLRWGLRDAKRSEAVSETSAARMKRSSIELDLIARLRESLAALTAQRRIEALLSSQALPQARATTDAAMRGLEQGSGQITDVLLAQSRLREIEMERVKVQAEQRMTLAEIERAVGGEL
ncbi:TolC family protein [Ferrovibrio sp.]|uniref:TolC family protein n=1 Tax=Ferrovibrio sp. TaxID=1917215 RepID=UPI002617E732|nr:TolC family protein [Ferrovibrio sp.]